MNPGKIADLLQPYTGSPAKQGPALGDQPDWPRIIEQLAVYLELIQKWNARINLTSIRAPEEIVRRHFGESLFVGSYLGASGTLLDFGSGAGFPGVPIQLLRPDLQVTLAESRSRKASFLRELVRILGLPTEVWTGRVEAMPVSRQFDAVALRAVDEMESAVLEASNRASEQLLIIGTAQSAIYPRLAKSFRIADPIALPESKDGVLLIAHRH